MNIINMAEELFVKKSEEIIPLSNTDAEKMKKSVLSAKDVASVMKILEEGMISRYSKAGRFEEILEIITTLRHQSFMEPATLCLCLKQGAICEAMLNYDEAMFYYSLGIEAYATMIEPDSRYGYWLFNNNAFCNDYERIFTDAQKLAEKAISIDGSRHNAWKNLGISLEHQDQYVRAAACYMASYIKCSGGSDPRPMMHLVRMFKRNDGLKDNFAKEAGKELDSIFLGPFKEFCLGETYYHCGRFDEAIMSYEKFYALAPSGYSSHLNYACRVVKELKELRQIEAQFSK